MCKTVFDRAWLSGTFIFLSFGVFFGGMLTALEGITHSRFKSPLMMLPILLLSTCAVTLFFILQKRIRRAVETLTATATVLFGDKEVKLTLLVDSGNLVREPVTGKRVIIIGESASKRINIPDGAPSFEIALKSATGASVKKAYQPDLITIDEEYDGESFLILPEISCTNFAGYDGIIPISNAMRRKK